MFVYKNGKKVSVSDFGMSGLKEGFSMTGVSSFFMDKKVLYTILIVVILALVYVGMRKKN